MQKLLNKGELMELVLPADTIRNHDTALPLAYRKLVQEKFKECGLEFDSSLYVTDCSTSNYCLVNLAELLVTSGKLGELLYELDTLKFQKKQLERKLEKSLVSDV